MDTLIDINLGKGNNDHPKSQAQKIKMGVVANRTAGNISNNDIYSFIVSLTRAIELRT